MQTPFMKLTMIAYLLAVAAFGAKPTPAPKADTVPEVDQATQVELLATQLLLSEAQRTAAPHIDRVNKANADAQVPLQAAAKQCDAQGKEKFSVSFEDRKVKCVAVPAKAQVPAPVVPPGGQAITGPDGKPVKWPAEGGTEAK